MNVIMVIVKVTLLIRGSIFEVTVIPPTGRYLGVGLIYSAKLMLLIFFDMHLVVFYISIQYLVITGNLMKPCLRNHGHKIL